MIGDVRRTSSYAPLRVLVYSSDPGVRVSVRNAIGEWPDREIAPVDFVDTATQEAAVCEMSRRGVDLAILDGEATPLGGLGLCKQLKDELRQYMPIVVITARPDDAWLARWSRADAVVSRPVDPVVLRQKVTPLLRGRMVG